MKKCSRCKEEKDESEFNKNIKMSDKLQTACRKCQAIQAAEYIANPEKLKRKKEITKMFFEKHPDYGTNYYAYIQSTPELKAKYAEKHRIFGAERYQKSLKFNEEVSTYHQSYYQEHKQEIDKVVKKWYNDHRNQQIAYYKEYRINHKLMMAAHAYIREQVKKGLLARPEICSSCGSDEYIEYHHPNYKEKEIVVALCRCCIKQKFGKIKRLQTNQ